MDWTAEWPTDPGWYWFYGYRFGRDDDKDKPELLPVQVWRIANGVAWVVGGRGHFMYQGEGTTGLWLPLSEPEAPVDQLDHPGGA